MQAILQNPEFLLAAIFTMLWAATRQQNAASNLCPAAYRDLSAELVVRALPARYLGWLTQTQIWSAWRKNAGFGEICALKITLCLSALATAIVLPFYMALPLALVCFFIPDLYIFVRMRRRQQAIVESLPQALDLMILCVDAGLGLDATVQRIARDQNSLSHVLNDELTALGRDILLGMQRERAYLELYNRTGVEELKTFASALNQSTKLGLSISRILRAQALYMRTRQQQKAEERAAKVPIWMAFPLWMCIMPALMLLLVGPSLLQFFQQVHHFPAEWFH
jgi:tight adherence protein C